EREDFSLLINPRLRAVKAFRAGIPSRSGQSKRLERQECAWARYLTPVTSRARSERPSSRLLHPASMPYGERSRMASIRWIFPFSSLNISASSQVQGVVGPP